MFQIRQADLHKLKQIIYDEIDVIPPTVLHGVFGTVLNEVHQFINLDGRHLTAVTLRNN